MATPFLSPDPSDTGHDRSDPSPALARVTSHHRRTSLAGRVTGTQERNSPRGLPRSSARLAQPLGRRKRLTGLFGRGDENPVCRTISRVEATEPGARAGSAFPTAENDGFSVASEMGRREGPPTFAHPATDRTSCGRFAFDEGLLSHERRKGCVRSDILEDSRADFAASHDVSTQRVGFAGSAVHRKRISGWGDVRNFCFAWQPQKASVAPGSWGCFSTRVDTPAKLSREGRA